MYARVRKIGLLLGTSFLGLVLAVIAVPFLGDCRIGAVPQPSEVIVVLAWDSTRDDYAVALVEGGIAPRLLSTLVDPQCVRAGRPPRDCASDVRSTVDEALLMRRALMAEGVQRATIVTSNYHVLRAAAVFSTVFIGSGIQVSVVAPPALFPSGWLLRSELVKFFPSVGAAVIGRLSPALYYWVVGQIREETRS